MSIANGVVRVRVDREDLENSQKEFLEITELCEKRKFAEAKTRLLQFLKHHTRHSEGYRILAQMTMEAGDIDKAIDIDIEALKCNPKNIWALLLMGNLYSKYKDDYEVAKTYYNNALKYDPDNFITINNIAAIMMENDDLEHAIPLFEKVLAGDKKYANAYYGLGVCYLKKEEYQKAFDTALKGSLAADRRSENPMVLEELHKLMVSAAHEVVKHTNYMNVMLGIKDAIEMTTKQKVVIEKDETMYESAKLEYGPTHHVNYHVIKYNPSKPYMEHLAIHELMHLEMNIEATDAHNNQVVYINNDNTIAFRTKYAAWVKKIVNRFGHSKAQEIVAQIQGGITLQTMNCPLDLFVEKRMYDKYPVVRAIQLLSLMEQETYNLKAIQGSEKAQFIPQSIVQQSKIMNIASSMHIEHLFGLRFYQMYKPTRAEQEQAKDLYDEYEAYDDYKPGEEYELVDYFISSLHLENLISMKSLDAYLNDTFQRQEDTKMFRDAALGKDAPKGGNSFDGLTEEQKKKQDTFYENNKDGEDPMKTMMMAMYMLGALEYFDGMSKIDIKKIAFEIAMIGTKGISPEQKSGYKVPSIPNKDFGGYQLLAYYYVSWALAIPEMLPSLGLPFDSAWETAQQMWKRKKGNQ